MLTTPESIRTLQRKLYRKAKQEPACRFHALYDKIYRADILSRAYKLVRANKGSAGIDGVTFEDIEAKEGTTAFVAELAEALRSKRYKPDPVKRVMIPKADGSERPLGVPTIRDRVVPDRKTGYLRFPHRDLYEKYGLYKVPTAAGWTRAHALR